VGKLIKNINKKVKVPLKPTKWFRVIDDNGELWMETSDEHEAISECKVGYSIMRMYVPSQDEEFWVMV